jgi:hypothetical protein
VTVSIGFGTLMGAIDASIVNVALPHLQGGARSQRSGDRCKRCSHLTELVDVDRLVKYRQRAKLFPFHL